MYSIFSIDHRICIVIYDIRYTIYYLFVYRIQTIHYSGSSNSAIHSLAHVVCTGELKSTRKYTVQRASSAELHTTLLRIRILIPVVYVMVIVRVCTQAPRSTYRCAALNGTAAKCGV